MKLRTLAMVVVAVMIAWGGVAQAQPHQKAPRRGIRNPMAALDLTEQQREKMKALRLAQARQMARLRANLQVARIELREALGQASPDPATVKAKVAAVNRARSAIFEKQTDARLEFGQVLTPEQRRKMKEVKQMRAKWSGRRGQGMRGRHRGMRKAPQARGPRNPMAALDLTEQQQERVKALRLAQAKQMAQLRADLQVARIELREALGQASPDPAAVKARVAAVNKARSVIFEKQTNARLEFSKILTPEQQKKLEALKQVRAMKRGGRGKGVWGGRRGMREGHGPCCPWGAAPPAPETQKK